MQNTVRLFSFLWISTLHFNCYAQFPYAVRTFLCALLDYFFTSCYFYLYFSLSRDYVTRNSKNHVDSPTVVFRAFKYVASTKNLVTTLILCITFTLLLLTFISLFYVLCTASFFFFVSWPYYGRSHLPRLRTWCSHFLSQLLSINPRPDRAKPAKGKRAATITW